MSINDLFFLSLRIYDTGLWLKEKYSLFRYRKWNNLAKRNESLRHYKKTDICYICGNGPSLKKVNLDLLDGDTIVMNDHWRIASKFKKTPTFYLINDNAYGIPSFKERAEGMLNCCPEIPHVLTTYMGPSMETLYGNCKTNVYFFNNIGRTFKSSYEIDFTKCTYYTWNVVTAAIQLAIYLDYKKIYLLGCDYSLFASRFLTHVYDKEGDKIENRIKLRDMLFKYSFTTHIHYEIAKYAKKHGVKIVNMTSETLLDAYDIDTNSKY